jgi:hypothetical protein
LFDYCQVTKPDTFDAIIEQHRCTAHSPGGRRCQLYTSHDGEHAAAWQDKARGRHPGDWTLAAFWTDGGSERTTDEWPRQPRCRMGTP